MPTRQISGDVLLSVEETMVHLNFTRDEVMRLVELKCPHTMKEINGEKCPYFGRKEILTAVTPRPAGDPLPEPEPIVEEVIPEVTHARYEPGEVRPDRIPSMEEKTAPVKPPKATGPPSKPKGKPATIKKKVTKK